MLLYLLDDSYLGTHIKKHGTFRIPIEGVWRNPTEE